METMKQYAKRKNITYEAVRKQIKRYEKELEGHIITQNKTKYLDDDAVKFLDEKRNGNPIIIQQADMNEELEYYKKREVQLLAKIAEQAEENKELYKVISTKHETISVLEKQVLMLELKAEQNKSIWARLFGKE